MNISAGTCWSGRTICHWGRAGRLAVPQGSTEAQARQRPAAVLPHHRVSANRMSTTHNVHTEIAESILEHAEAITRLDADGMDPAAYDAAIASHVGAMRLLAVPHMDPQPDRKLGGELE